MHTPSPAMRSLAQRLLATNRTGSARYGHQAATEVIEKLRISLLKFAGDEGLSSLLQRALVMASAEVPSLQSLKIGADGRLEGLAHLAAATGADAAGEAEVAVAVHLLELLATFIGEPLTLRLVQGNWPEPTQGK